MEEKRPDELVDISVFEKGYRPKVEAGQSLDEFESEELKKHGMTFKDLVKTTYYWDVFVKDTGNKDVVDEAHARGLNPGKPGVPIVSGTPDGVPSSNLPEVAEYVEKKAEPKEMPEVSDVLPQAVAPVEFKVSELKLVDYVSSFKSKFVAKVSEVFKVPFYTWDWKIGPFKTNVEFLDKRRELIEMIRDYYSGIIVDLPSAQSPSDPTLRILDLTKSGIDAMNWLNMAASNETGGVTAAIRELYLNDQAIQQGGAPYQDRANLFITEVELDIKNDLSNEYQYFLNIVEASDFQKFMRNADNYMEHVDPMPVDYDPRFFKFPIDPRFDNSRFLIIENRRARPAYVDTMLNMIQQSVAIPVKESKEVVKQLMEAVGFSITTADQSFNIPNQISVTKAQITAQLMFLTSVASAFYAGRYTVDPSSLNIGVLIDCILKHALTPKLGLLRTSWIDIRNYIARFLLPNLSCVGQGYVPPTSLQCRLGGFDYLTQAINDGFFGGGANGATISDFFRTWGLDSGNVIVENFANATDPLFSGREQWYCPLAGVTLDTPIVTPPRWQAYMVASSAIMATLTTRQNGSISQRVVTQIKSVLNFTHIAEVNISAMCFYGDLAIRKLMMSPMCFGMNPETMELLASPGAQFDRDDSLLVSKEVPLFGEMSLAFLVSWEDAVSKLKAYDTYRAGALVNQSMNELAEAYVHVSDERYFDRNEWTTPKRFEKMFDYVRNDSPFLRLFREKLGNAPYTKLMRWPNDVGRSPWLNSLERAFRFVEAMQNRLGYVDRFFYAPAVEEGQLYTDVIRNNVFLAGDYFLLDENAVRVTHVYETYSDVLADIQNNALRGRFQLAKAEGGVVQFNMPVMLEMVNYGKDEPRDKAPVPITWSSSTLIAELHSVGFLFRWASMYINQQSNDLAMTQIPEWLASTDGLEFGTIADTLRINIRDITYFKDGFQNFTDFTWSRTF
jgi:hypothetical protein